MWAHQFGEPGLFSSPELTDLYRRPCTSTCGKSINASEAEGYLVQLFPVFDLVMVHCSSSMRQSGEARDERDRSNRRWTEQGVLDERGCTELSADGFACTNARLPAPIRRQTSVGMSLLHLVRSLHTQTTCARGPAAAQTRTPSTVTTL